MKPTTHKTKNRMQKLRITFTIILFIPCILLSAQNFGEIHGQVMDAETGDPVPFANVYIKAGDHIVRGTTSDFDGYFRLNPVPVGTHTVSVSFTGYGTMDFVNVQVDADKITFVRNINLDKGYNLPPAIVICTKDILDIDDPSKKTMDMMVVKKMANSSNFSGILTAMSSDIYASEDQKQIHFRGSRANDAIYIVDGVKMVNSSAMIPTRGIGNMTVYSGGVPAKYGDFTGGVIIVESEGYFSWMNKKRARELSQ